MSICVYDVDPSVCRVCRILIVWLKCGPSALCGVPVYYWVVFILLSICMSICVYDVDLSVCRVCRIFIVWLKCGPSALCGVPVTTEYLFFCLFVCRGYCGGSPIAVRPSDLALSGSCPLVTSYYCRLGDLLCFMCVYHFVCALLSLHVCLCCFRCLICLL